MRTKATTLDAMKFSMRGAHALAKATHMGWRFDKPKGLKAMASVTRDIDEMEQEIWDSDMGQLWRSKYGRKASIGSRDQLTEILFKEMEFPVTKLTKGGDPATDDDALSQTDHPTVDMILGMRKLDTLRDFIKQWARECIDGRVHANYGLARAISYRSNSTKPNAQNIPVRNKKLANIIRGLIHPDNGCQLGELDHSSLEVRIACCYHKDPRMLAYLLGEGDMHFDAAMDCYLVLAKMMNDIVRFAAKSEFVFAEFYGSYWKQVAVGLWKACRELKLMVGDVPMREHLVKALKMPTTAAGARAAAQDKDLKKVGDEVFEGGWTPTLETVQLLIYCKHIKHVEKVFWKDRFPVYDQWRRDWFAEYQEKGYLDMYTGFRCEGIFRKNAVINYPVQGTAFHVLLWGFIRLSEELERKRMDTYLLGQIHDSIVANISPGEKDEYLAMANRIMTKDILEDFDWITVPLKVDAEIAPVNGSWFEKVKVKLAAA